MKKELNFTIHNRFDIEVKDIRTGKIRQRAQAFNVICQGLWDCILAKDSNNQWYPLSYFSYIVYGRGTGTPSASDTSLFNLIAGVDVSEDTITKTWDHNNRYISGSRSIILQAATSAGESIKEIGIAYDSSYHLATHALLQDMNGNQITINKTSTDVITIKATVYIRYPSTGWLNDSIIPLNSTRGVISGQGFWNVLLGCVWTTTGNMSHKLRETRYLYPYCYGESSSCRHSGGIDTTLYLSSFNKSQKKMSFKGRFEATDNDCESLRFFAIGAHNHSNSSPTSPDLSLEVTSDWYNYPTITGESIGTGNGSNRAFKMKYPVKSISKVYIDGIEVSSSNFIERLGPQDGNDIGKFMNWISNETPNPNTEKPQYKYDTNDYYSDASVVYRYGELELSYLARRPIYLENPFYLLGIKSLQISQVNSAYYDDFEIAMSNDLSSWTVASTFQPLSSGVITVTIPSNLRQYKYIRFRQKTSNKSGGLYITNMIVDDPHPDANIYFNTAPASGSVITVDYVPDCISKNVNNVFDLQIDITLGEYAGA